MRLLDLCCGSGGAAVGYERAGFDEIVGLDWEGQRGWPLRFGFIMEDVVEWLEWNFGLLRAEFDAIHASPPCQRWSNATPDKDGHKDLITPIRHWISKSGLPYVIENVVQAPLKWPVMLCGSMFDLGVVVDSKWHQLRRHRAFETNWRVDITGMVCKHNEERVVTVAGSTGRGFTIEDRKKAMGIDWMINEDLKEAVPPAYTEFLGRQMIKVVQGA